MAPNVLHTSTYGNFVSVIERVIAKSSIQRTRDHLESHRWYGDHATSDAMKLWHLPHRNHFQNLFCLARFEHAMRAYFTRAHHL
jgi:hypothetical protein